MSTSTLQLALPLSRPAIGRSAVAHWLVLGGMAVVYLLLFFYYYPGTHGIEDEVGFINQAIVWSHGAISAESAGFDQLKDFVECKGRHVCWRNPGRSLLILPLLMLGGLSAIFVSGAVIHLLVTLTTALTLAKLGRSPLWAALVLCHPTLALYSRAIMADEPAALGLTCALLAFVAANRPGEWAGTAIGVAAVMRYQVGVVLPCFALAILAAPHIRQRGRQALYCLIAGGAFAAVLMVYNLYLYGKPTGLVGQGSLGSFGLQYLSKNMVFYALSLSVVWPLLILAPVFDRSNARYAVLAISVPLLLLTSCWYFHDQHASFAYTLVLGQRLLIPLIPALVVAYAGCLERVILDRWLQGRARTWVFAGTVGSCAVLLLLLGVAFQRHDALLRSFLSAREEMAQTVPANSLVIGNTTLEKLFAVPSPGIPTYRWCIYDHHGFALDQSDAIEAEQGTWYLALLPKSPGDERPELLRDYVSRYQMTRVPTENSTLILYRADAPSDTGTQKNETSPAPGASKR